MAVPDLSYGQLLLEAQKQTGYQEVGETVQPIMKRLEETVNQIVQMQYEALQKPAVNQQEEEKIRLAKKKYYIHIFIVKDGLAYHGMQAPNVLRIRKPQCRITRPSPYQEEDHYLWSVTNMDQVKFEWCIPDKSAIAYILKKPHEFDVNYVRMLKKYCNDSLEKHEDYLINGKLT